MRSAGAPRTPRAALEDAIRRALARPPCGVAFSGGRDSSVLLAVAAGLARREGLPAPIAVTLEFAGEGTHETDWQEQVLAHLKISEWVRLPIGSELDLVGPVAAEGLRRHGLLFPPNAHVIVPLARAAAGGTILTGVHGDDVFGRWPWHDVADLLGGRRRPTRRDVRRLAHWLAPLPVRAEVVRRHDLTCSLPWLRQPFRAHAERAVATELARGPRTWQARLAWTARRRAWHLTNRSMSRLAADHGAQAGAPFLDPGFLDALGRAGGRWGWGARGSTMRALFGDLLPDAVLARTTKAEFSSPLFESHTRCFVESWNGVTGVDPELVDADVLRAIWTMPRPPFMSASLLQAAWLACDRAATGPSTRQAA